MNVGLLVVRLLYRLSKCVDCWVDCIRDCIRDCKDRACPVFTLCVRAVEHSKSVDNVKMLVKEWKK